MHLTLSFFLSILDAFRTGKSFLLSWIVKYLTQKTNLLDSESKVLEKSFDWEGGEQHSTIGMWMYSEPFILTGDDGSKLALLLIDTQGMNDNQTAGGIQASIFGLSVLMSSCQVYNINFQIQEDHLQQLVFFSEYGRVALGQFKGDTTAGENKEKPFHHLEFLVRNFQLQHFDLDAKDNGKFLAVEAQMNVYLEMIMSPCQSTDLNSSRNQNTSCFKEVSTILLPHKVSWMQHRMQIMQASLRRASQNTQ
jgi:atlastin